MAKDESKTIHQLAAWQRRAIRCGEVQPIGVVNRCGYYKFSQFKNLLKSDYVSKYNDKGEIKMNKEWEYWNTLDVLDKYNLICKWLGDDEMNQAVLDIYESENGDNDE